MGICRTFLLSALFAASLGTAQVVPSAPSSLEEALRSGSEAMRTGRFNDAEKWFQTAVKTSPENADALLSLGIAELRLGKPAEAAEFLNRLIKIEPNQTGTNLFLGIAYAQMHKVPEAVATLQRELKLDPKNAQAAMWLGVVELQDGHPEKATEPLDRAAELAPNDLNILEYRGEAHSDVAYASYARMAAIDPNSWHVHKVQGRIYAQQNLHKEAIAEFQVAIKLVPNNSDLYEELAGEYWKSSALDLAQQAYAKELELSPNNPIAMYNLGKIDIETNHTQEGLRLLRKVIANYENVPATYFYLGVGEFDSENAKEAANALEKARALHPDPELALRIEFQLARVYRKLGRSKDAQLAAREYARLKAQSAKFNPQALKAISAGFGSAEVPAAEAGNKQ